jgi:hypothetical protein
MTTPSDSRDVATGTNMAVKPSTWRDEIKVHPAADLFPPMSDADLDALGADIKKNGLAHRITLWGPRCSEINKDFQFKDFQLLDGRNRLEAMVRAGIQVHLDRHFEFCFTDMKIDPYEYVVSANIHRRHLTAEQKRNLIAQLLKREPGKSDRAVAKAVRVDHKTVAAVRAEAQGRGEIPHVDVRTDSKGRKQPARKTTNREAKKFDGPAAIRALAAANARIPVFADFVRARLDGSAAPALVAEASPANAKSWRVEVVAKDGRRFKNGVRLETEEDADIYRFVHVGHDFWDMYHRQHAVPVATYTFPSADEPTAAYVRRKNGKLTYTLRFLHGTCGTFPWTEVGAEPRSTTLTAEESAATRKAEYATSEGAA